MNEVCFYFKCRLFAFTIAIGHYQYYRCGGFHTMRRVELLNDFRGNIYRGMRRHVCLDSKYFVIEFDFGWLKKKAGRSVLEWAKLGAMASNES